MTGSDQSLTVEPITPPPFVNSSPAIWLNGHGPAIQAALPRMKMALAVCPITISVARSRVDAGALVSSNIFNNSPSSECSLIIDIQEEPAVWREDRRNVFPDDSEPVPSTSPAGMGVKPLDASYSLWAPDIVPLR